MNHLGSILSLLQRIVCELGILVLFPDLVPHATTLITLLGKTAKQQWVACNSLNWQHEELLHVHALKRGVGALA